MRLLTSTDGVARRQPDGTWVLVDGPIGLGEWFMLHGSHTVAALAVAPPIRHVDPRSLTWANVADCRTRVWGIGLNYRSKVAITGRTPPDEPTVFLRSTATGASPGGGVPLPLLSERVDFEGELAIVVGRTLSPQEPSPGWDAVAFVTAGNDITARDVMKRTGNPALAKSFPGFGPIGPELVSPDELGEPDDVPLRTYVNGELRQDDRTSGMLHRVPDILALLARYSRLEPGDVVLTGSPAGAGDDDGRYLREGDAVAVHVADLEPLVSVIGAS